MTKEKVDEACKLALVSTPRSAQAWIESGIRFAEEHHAAELAARWPRPAVPGLKRQNPGAPA